MLPAIQRAAKSATDAAVIRALVDAGADPSAEMARGYEWAVAARPYGYTPLHTAAASNPVPGIIEALVAAGADVHGRNRDEETPLHAAWENPNPAVVQALLRSGADPLARDERGRVADPTACANWNTPAFARLALPSHFELCLAQGEGAEVNARDPDGYVPEERSPNYRTPLFDAVFRPALWNHYVGPWPTRGNTPVIEALVRAGADLDQADGAGRTPLHAAAQTYPAVFPLLLRLGADPNVRDANGKTPMDYALENRSLEGLPEVQRLREAMRRGVER